MKHLFFILGFLCLSSFATEKFYRVAIIDTGLDLNDARFKDVICKDGHHWDFVRNKPMDYDSHGHGTHVAGLIKQNAGSKKNYCFLIYRYYDNSGLGYNNFSNEVLAFQQAAKDGANIINLSGGGPDSVDREFQEIKKHPEITFVVAAGNDNNNIDVNGYYPAAYNLPNVISVGSLTPSCRKMPSSNYGTKVKAWEQGLSQLSTLPGGREGYMSGTSQATAIHTGKLISNATAIPCIPR